MISLNYRDSRPIYEQVKDGLLKLMISGALPPGEKLPSVRELAASLAINPNTIQRAYRELEAQGLIYSIPGKGSFAAEPLTVNSPRREEQLAQFDKLASELYFLGLSPEELKARLDLLFSDWRDSK